MEAEGVDVGNVTAGWVVAIVLCRYAVPASAEGGGGCTVACVEPLLLPLLLLLQDPTVGDSLLQLIQGRFEGGDGADADAALQRALELVTLGGGIDK